MKAHLIKQFILVFLMALIAWQGFAGANNEPCLTVSRVKIVVIGEDIYQGIEKNKENNWLSKYRQYLKSFNSDNDIINLTREGINSYNIVPSNASNPYQRPKPDPEYNITKALKLNPDAIIVNLEYNDLMNNFQDNEQIINIMLIATEANKNNIPIWINTPKPTAVDTLNSSKEPEAMKDLIVERFSPFVVNFWEDLADEKGHLKTAYATTDDFKINDKGQELMVSKLIQADIHQYCARRMYRGGKDISIYSLKNTSQQINGVNNEKFEVTIANSGSELPDAIHVTLELINEENLETIRYDQVIEGGLESCQFKSLEFNIADLPKGNYKVSAYFAKRVDRNASNDTTHIRLNHTAVNIKNPSTEVKAKKENDVSLYAINIDGFSTQFNRYNQQENYSFSNSGEAKLYNIKSIISNEEIEGTSFKILADRAIAISAIEVEVDSPGTKLVEIFYKRNVDESKDNSLNLWTLANSQEIKVEKGTHQIEIATKNIPLKRNDNIGFYIRTKDLSGAVMSKSK